MGSDIMQTAPFHCFSCYHLSSFFYLLYFLPGTGLDSESRGEPNGIPCAGVGGAAVRAHRAEVDAAVVIRGTLPPMSSGTGGGVAGPVSSILQTLLVH